MTHLNAVMYLIMLQLGLRSGMLYQYTCSHSLTQELLHLATGTVCWLSESVIVLQLLVCVCMLNACMGYKGILWLEF